MASLQGTGLSQGTGPSQGKPPRIGSEIQRLRQSRGLTLDDLALRSGVSKSILSQIERDQANPTLATIWRISNALNQRMEDLFTPMGKGAAIARTPAQAIPEITDEVARYRLRILSPPETVSWLQWYELILHPGGRLDSQSHGNGTFEHLYVQAGAVKVTCQEEEVLLETGQTARFETASRHVLENPGTTDAFALMVNTLLTQ